MKEGDLWVPLGLGGNIMNFDMLNQQTKRESMYCTPPSQNTSLMRGTQPVWSEQRQNRLNNDTYKENNGDFSRHYF